MRQRNSNLATFLAIFLGSFFTYSLCASVQANGQNEKLLSAIRDADLPSASNLLSGGADVNAKDEDGLTALMYAAMYAGADYVELLLTKGADPNAKSNGNVTALMLATGDARKVRLLLAKGAEVNTKSKQGNTALSIAGGREGSLEVVKLLLAQGANLNEGNPLGAAVRSGDIRVVRFLLKKGADPISNKNAGGPTPASEKRLRERNKDQGAVSALPLLGIAGNLGGTPLMHAALARNVEVVKLLLARGADVKTINTVLGGSTALILAAQIGDSDTIRLLLEKGAPVNVRHASGYTALMYAAASESHDSEMIKALLARGAEVNVKANDGESALTLARKKGNTEIVRLLEQAGVKQ